ncbi:Hypothetical predicted protein [Mytilus galloprovincialis]|uniref:Uncharacterized protein n=1 Tax=Mytilus galloprovincialis TaxID=29158 RepID=A0A8B6CMF0_MYTGA|nr:Hypothetical predicted protein [Mytilus galloprovincialis]
MGHVDLPIKIGNYTIIQKFTVAEIDVPAVIGYDFLHKNNCTIDMGKGFSLNEPRSEKLRRLSSSSCDEVNELPSLLQDLKLRSSELLSEGQIDQLESLLKRHNQTFSKNKDDLGRATAIKHKIDTGNAKPVKATP